MERMAYIFTPGAKLNTKLVYVPQEKFLYIRNVTNADGTVTYICSDCKTIPVRCTARIVLIDDKYCKYTDQSKNHNGHANHEKTYKKNFVCDAFKRRALDVADFCGWQSEKVAIRPILKEVLQRYNNIRNCIFSHKKYHYSLFFKVFHRISKT